jgi:ribosomal protein S18 acetylase RimI-like enzyme
MTTPFVVRRARPADAPSMAKVHVDTWRETYRGIVDDSVLDDPALLSWRETFWTAALTDHRYSQNVAAVATHGGAVVGIAMSGPSLDDLEVPQQLYLLYVYAASRGRGIGAALLDAVVDPTAGTVLWVADPNPRAQAFYRRHGFAADGGFRIGDHVREVRMTRGSSLP